MTGCAARPAIQSGAEVEGASFLLRAVAFGVDLAAFVAAGSAVMLAAMAGGAPLEAVAGRPPGAAELLLAPLGAWLYFAGMESSGAGATLGKRAAGLVVCDASGAQLTFAQASARFALAAVCLVTGLAAAYSREGWALRRTRYDLVTRTVVVRRRGPSPSTASPP